MKKKKNTNSLEIGITIDAESQLDRAADNLIIQPCNGSNSNSTSRLGETKIKKKMNPLFPLSY